jgi:hypothetical protein
MVPLIRQDFIRRMVSRPSATWVERAAQEILVSNPMLPLGCMPTPLRLVAWALWFAAIGSWQIVGWWALVPITALVFVALLLESRRGRSQGVPAHCPACGYDLRGLPEAVPVEVLGVRLGPRRCVECGEPWPRVPGPVA